MGHQVISNQLNRRGFLKRSVLGAGAFAGLPSLSVAALGKASRIEALELLVLQRNREQRRVLKVISSTGAAGFADFPDIDYAPAMGGVAKKHLIRVVPADMRRIIRFFNKILFGKLKIVRGAQGLYRNH